MGSRVVPAWRCLVSAQTIMQIVEVVKALLPIGEWIVGMVLRFIDGDDGEDVARALDGIPAEWRSRVEAVRQRKLTEDALRADLGLDRERMAGDLSERLRAAGMPQADEWALALHGLGPVPHVPANPYGDGA